MNKLRNTFVAACALMLASIGVAKADSSNFAGTYIGLSASGYGVEASGESNSGAAAVGETSTIENDKLSVGKVAGVAGVELGYVLPLGEGRYPVPPLTTFTATTPVVGPNPSVEAAATVPAPVPVLPTGTCTISPDS